MKKLLVLAVFLAALAVTASSAAHPLGNFTINRYSELDVTGNRLYVRYVLDMAEIPTFQAKSEVAARGKARYAASLARRIARRLELSVDGKTLALTPTERVLAFPPGQAGLRTTRLEIVFRSRTLETGHPLAVVYHDRNFTGRIGWKEIVVESGAGAQVLQASAPGTSVSDGLLSYPKNLLQSPLDVTSATARVVPGNAAVVPPALASEHQLEQRVSVRAVSDGGFASLIARDNLSIGFILISLAIAMFWGAAHALSPGHGKSIVAAYLVGSRGTPRHAVFLGLTVTVTHTIGVFALGLITLSLSEFIVPDQLYPWLNLVSALLIVAVGASVLRWRVSEWRTGKARSNGPHHLDHDQAHTHDHGHGPGHGHTHDPALSLRRLLGVGVAGGIVPCPTALVVLLAAISLHRIGYGLVLILAFSFGLAAAMTGIGVLAVTAKRVFKRVDFESGLVRLLPAVSAFVVLGLGLAMTVRALPKLT
jgi:nickel/cobalt transporter (NicO) family protein